MFFKLDNLGEKTINKIAEVALSTKLEKRDKLAVKVKTDPNLLAKGTLESLVIDCQGLMVENAKNAERPRMRGSDTLAKIAMGAASLAGGFYLGKQLGKSGFGDTSKLDRGSWRLKKQY